MPRRPPTRSKPAASRTRAGADLHVHTTHSDGVCTPAAVVIAAAAVGLEAVAITDHDTLSALPIALSGCVVGTIASTAVDVVTLPVKAASAGVDAVTTSQSEADEKRGRELRKQDERRAREARRLADRCRAEPPLPGDECGAVSVR